MARLLPAQEGILGEHALRDRIDRRIPARREAEALAKEALACRTSHDAATRPLQFARKFLDR